MGCCGSLEIVLFVGWGGVVRCGVGWCVCCVGGRGFKWVVEKLGDVRIV